MDRRILVVTSCTGEKCYKPENELIQDDFRDSVQKEKREKELSQYKISAGKLYTGKQHVSLMNGVAEYRSIGGKIDVDILSAGYGLLDEDDAIVPYEVTFSTMNSLELKGWSKFLGVTADLQQKIKGYDLVFLLLGDKYLQAVNWLKLESRIDQKLIFFAGESGKHKILLKPNYHMIAVTEQEAKFFHSGLVEIKGFLMAMLLRFIRHEHSLWDTIFQDPSLVREYILAAYKKEQTSKSKKVVKGSKSKQISMFNQQLNAENEQVYKCNQISGQNEDILKYYTIDIPENEIAINYGHDFKYYMPENDDRVDPDYDFLKDKLNRTGDPLDHDVYAHQLHGMPKYDGILISKINIDGASQKKKEKINELGIRKFLRLPDNYPIMGDCGAFSYINEVKPPYTTEQVLDYYHSLGFDYGVSVDHLIVGQYMKDEAERNRRYRLTLDNARDFIEKYQQNKERYGYTFTPIGIAQGWDPVSFREAVKELVNMGYQYVALGGLAMEKSFNIFEILKEIAPIIPNKNFKMHLFGVVRDNMEFMRAFHKLGVTSFDSASPLRRAWLGSEHNYYAPDRHYAAIRIPEATANSPRVKQQIKNYLRTLYFGTKENYNTLEGFFKGYLVEGQELGIIAEEVLVVLPYIWDLDLEDPQEKLVKCYEFFRKYLEFEELVLKSIKAYDTSKTNVREAVQQVAESVKKLGLNNKSAEDYQEVYIMFDQFKELEQKALKALRFYDKGLFDIETTLRAILEYDEKLGEDREKHAFYYQELLEEQPWKTCDCKICKKCGVEVIIFRGNNRNRRRGFHNTHVFYKQICQLKEEIRNELESKKEKPLVATFHHENTYYSTVC